ncbi:MAG: hypothetical protein NT074_02860 [Methanomicrobiales archaeon]|jgi:ribonuclease-3|nr:hypothetical protein [Methanomicrobiales archaeon]
MNIEGKIGYLFCQREPLTRALTRKAFANEQRQRKVPCEDQEIYATLGDAVLKTVLVDLLIRHGASTPDEITRRKRDLEREEVLARVGRELGIGPHIHLGVGERRQGADNEPYVLAETMEAIIGAIFIDGGYRAAEERITAWFQRLLSQEG